MLKFMILQFRFPAMVNCHNSLIVCIQYKVLLYSLDGRCQSTYSAYEMALGVKVVTWSPTSQFLAIGSYDEKVIIFLWRVLAVCWDGIILRYIMY
jgi:hypothetical protein